MKLKEAIIEVSYNCNLSCIMCGFGQQAFDKDKFMSFESYKIIIDEIGDKIDVFRLNGRGESTIHPQFIEMIDYAKNKFPQVGINLFTNLSIKKNAVIEKFIEHDVQLFISIDSDNKRKLEEIRKGADYNLILSNLDKITTIKKRPFIVFTIQELNIDELYEIALFAKKNNCHILYNTIRRDNGMDEFKRLVSNKIDNIKNCFKRAINLYNDTELMCLFPSQISGFELNLNNSTLTHGQLTNCPMIDNEICVLHNGDVTPCNMFNPYVYGNIHNDNLTEIWNGDKRREFKLNHKSYYYCDNCANLGK